MNGMYAVAAPTFVCQPDGPAALAFNPLALPKAGGASVPYGWVFLPQTQSLQQKHCPGKVVFSICSNFTECLVFNRPSFLPKFQLLPTRC